MQALSCQEIRDLWVEFFTKKCPSAHKHIKSASLVPDNPTLLLNAAGMVQFVPIFLGTKPATEPPRAVTIQKCARVGGKDSDLENIGRTARHHSFFEMLGNFSFGDYFKQQAIPWAWQFVTEELKLDKEKLYVSVFAGDEQNPFDQEAYDTWKEIISEDRIWKMSRKDNFWGPPGETGPCGPCSEIYYEVNPSATDFDDRYTEIWNLVFMEFFKDENANFSALEKKNIDTGAGLERIATILQDVNNTFETDELFFVLEKIATRLAIKYQGNNSETDLYLKIITDHLRCAAFLIADGVRPSNLGRGYVLRMIIRRASRFVYLIQNKAEAFLTYLAKDLAQAYQKAYPELNTNLAQIESCLEKEELAFAKTLEQGLEILNKKLSEISNKELDGEFAFNLYSTYGFPLELTKDIVEQQNISINLEEFEIAKEKHTQASGSGAVAKSVEQNTFIADILKEHGKTNFIGYHDNLKAEAKVLYVADNKVVLDQTCFYAESGGQIADIGKLANTKVTNVKSIEGVFVHQLESSAELKVNDIVSLEVDKHNREFTKKHHTSCHLLQAALRNTLGSGIQQMGSQVGAEYTRFDFNLDRAMTKQEISAVENQINLWIEKDLSVETKVMQFDDAVKAGALSFFEDKYDDEVRVLFIGDASIELCGGTHVDKLSEIKNIVIAQEGSIASGIRRIKLLANTVADEFIAEKDKAFAEQKALEEQKEKEKEAQKAKLKIEKEELLALTNSILEQADQSNETKVVILYANEFFNKEYSSESIKALVENLTAKNPASFLVFIACHTNDKVVFYSAVSNDLIKEFNAGNIVKEAAKICGGGGGGRPNFAQAGGKDISKIHEAISFVKNLVLGQAANA